MGLSQFMLNSKQLGRSCRFDLSILIDEANEITQILTLRDTSISLAAPWLFILGCVVA
jgi:hypothetical protein